MDGWREDETGPTVVEIKTTYGDVNALGDGIEEHWNQARVYGAIRCLQTDMSGWGSSSCTWVCPMPWCGPCAGR